MTGAQVIHGDCMDVLAGMAANTVDAIVCDPPYEIGFMGKGWDGSGIAYRVELWAECLRVLKPGGHLLAFGATRTYHRMTSAIDDAGFDIRDSLHWIYGSGFPKSLDVSKAIDKAAGAEREVVGRYQSPENTSGNKGHTDFGTGRAGDGLSDITAPATDAARQWSGWGTALKPAHEPIVVARKPLTGTVAATVLTHGTGALNIDGCRVGCTDKTPFPAAGYARHDTDASYEFAGDPNFTTTGVDNNPTGRWPANLVFTHAHNCAQVAPGSSTSTPAEEVAGGIWAPSEGKPAGPTYSDTPAAWRCAPGCPVAELDGQSGVSKSGAAGSKGSSGFAGGYDGDYTVPYGDTGGASRFFTVTEWDPTADVPPFRYVAKPSKRERNAGLDGLEGQSVGAEGTGLAIRCATCDASVIDGCDCPDRTFVNPTRQNHHPTVKPVALMRWLVRLVTPPGGTVLDPFAGSGTTLVAATLEGFHAIGIELTDDYHPIIAGRIAWAEAQAAAPADTLFDPRTATA